MKLRRAFVCFALLIVTTLSATAAPKQYQHLKDAVADMDRILTADKRDELVALMVPAKEGETSFATNPGTYEVLKQQWKEAGPFVKLYADKDFPKQGETFKLGGHEKELGHTHIDFTRTKEGWVLSGIYQCR